MLVKLESKDTTTVVNALIENARSLPQELYKFPTWDRGKEMAAHKQFTLATDIQVYFCDPKSPAQRGSNDNTVGADRNLTHGGAAKNLDWLSSDPQPPAVLGGAAKAE